MYDVGSSRLVSSTLRKIYSALCLIKIFRAIIAFALLHFFFLLFAFFVFLFFCPFRQARPSSSEEAFEDIENKQRKLSYAITLILPSLIFNG